MQTAIIELDEDTSQHHGGKTGKRLVSGLSLNLNRYQDIDKDFEILSAPSQPQTSSAWAWYHDCIARKGSVTKADLNIRDIAPFARHLWMIEHHLPRDRFTIRVWSSGSTEMIGLDLTGEEVRETGPVAKWPRLYREVIKKKVPVVLRNSMSETEKDFLTTEVAVLPLDGKNSETRFILCPFALVPTP